MSDLLKKVAKLLGVPESLIQRSSEARAEASGKSISSVPKCCIINVDRSVSQSTKLSISEEPQKSKMV